MPTVDFAGAQAQGALQHFVMQSTPICVGKYDLCLRVEAGGAQTSTHNGTGLILGWQIISMHYGAVRVGRMWVGVRTEVKAAANLTDVSLLDELCIT